MRRALLLLCASCMLTSPSIADEETKGAGPEVSKDSDSAKALNDFISRAVDDGLLNRPGAVSPAEVPSSGLTRPETASGCAIVADADFTPQKSFNGFSDLMELEASEVPFPAVDRIKARMAIGLYSEARSLAKGAGSDSSYLLNLAHLLEYQSSPTPRYFTKYSRCGVPANFWSAIAKLADHDESGVEDLEAGISYYRDLPMQMQIDIVTIAVPALDGYGERLTARKLMTAFTDDDIKNSSNLQFSAALLDENAEKKIDEFIIRPEFRMKALSAIVQRGDTLSTPQRELLLEEVADIIDTETDEYQLTIALKFALQEFGKRSNVPEMLALARLPKLQSPAARNTILQHIATVVARDLQSDDQMKVLSTIETLFDHSDVLEGHASTASLYTIASERARALGYSTLARRLIDKDQRELEDLLQKAELAFRKNEQPRLYAIADQRPASPELALLAARAALEASDTDNIEKFQSRLLNSPDKALRLIQEDAAVGKWLVAEEVYLAAGSTSNISEAAEAANILALRREALAAKQRPEIGLGSVETILARSTKDLNPKSKEVN